MDALLLRLRCTGLCDYTNIFFRMHPHVGALCAALRGVYAHVPGTRLRADLIDKMASRAHSHRDVDFSNIPATSQKTQNLK